MATGTESDGKRSIVLRPEDWSSRVVFAVVFVAVFLVLAFLALLVLGLVSSDKTSETTTTAPPVAVSPALQAAIRCFETAGVGAATDHIDDFVAENASGGAIKARVENNVVTISDGLTPAGGIGIVHGYRRLSSDLPLAQILRRHGRFALLWGRAPRPLQTATVARCLG